MNIQKRLAAQITKSSSKRIKFDNTRLADIKEAITKTDVRQLIGEGAIVRIQKRGVSRSRARHLMRQKAKGLRSGPGTRKGKETSRLSRKQSWITRIRSQREFLKELKEKQLISNETFRKAYLKAKGGYFRSTRHIKIFLEDNKLFQKSNAPKIDAKVAANKEKKAGKTKVAGTTKKSKSDDQ